MLQNIFEIPQYSLGLTSGKIIQELGEDLANSGKCYRSTTMQLQENKLKHNNKLSELK